MLAASDEVLPLVAERLNTSTAAVPAVAELPQPAPNGAGPQRPASTEEAAVLASIGCQTSGHKLAGDANQAEQCAAPFKACMHDLERDRSPVGSMACNGPATDAEPENPVQQCCAHPDANGTVGVLQSEKAAKLKQCNQQGQTCCQEPSNACRSVYIMALQQLSPC